MIFDLRYFVSALSILAISNGLPFDSPQNVRAIAPRAKSYSIVNVDGGSTAPPEAEPTTIVEERTKTETVKITKAVPTVTDTATVIVTPTPAPAPTSTPKSSSSSSASTSTPASSSSKIPQHTIAPSVVTIIITETSGPTEYYDNGLWHTSYPVKTFETVAITTLAEPSEASPVPSR